MLKLESIKKMIKKIRQYVDINGKERTLEYVEENVRIVEWSKYHPPSVVHLYKLEGSYVYIPENVWSSFGIGSIIREIEVNE